MNDTCSSCSGIGYRSAAKDMGMEDMPSILCPIGCYPCPACNGTGKSKFADIEKLLSNVVCEKCGQSMGEHKIEALTLRCPIAAPIAEKGIG